MAEHLLGEASALGAATIWAFSMTLYTRFGRAISPRVLNLYKSMVAIAFLTLLGSLKGWDWPESTEVYRNLLISGAIGLALGDSLLFFALQTLGAQKTSVIQCLSPALAAVLAWIAFGEKLSVWEWSGLLLTTGALGFLMIGHARESREVHEAKLWWLGVSAALGSALCQALAMITLRHSLQGGDVWTGTLIRILAAFVLLGGLSILLGEIKSFVTLFQPPSKGLALGFAAFLGTFIGLLLMSTSAKYAKAGVATALSSTSPLWLVPITHFFLKETVTRRAILCTVAAVAGVILMMAEQFH